MTREDTLHLILQNKFDRVENLVQMNHAATLAIPTVLATIWGIDGGLNNFINAWILSILSIGLILIWRYFAHYLDDDIACNYINIIKVESQLKVPRELSLCEKLIKELTTSQDVKKFENHNRVVFLEKLNQKKWMGCRGHDKWDKVAFTLIGICVFVSIVTFFGPVLLKGLGKIYSHNWHNIVTIQIGFIGLAIICGLIITVILYKIFQKYTPIHRYPPESEDIQTIVNEIIAKKTD